MYLLILPLVSVILLALSFTFYHLGFLVLIAFVPLFEFIRRSRKAKWSVRKTTLVIWLSGLVFFAYNLAWVLNVRPDIWARINGKTVTAAVIFVWFLSMFAYSSGFALFTLATSRLKDRNLFSNRYLWLLPAIWIVCEYARAWVVTIATWGPGASLGPHWNFAALGFGLSGTPLVFLSRFLGLYGLGGLVILINLCLYRLMRKDWRPAAYVFAPVLVLCLIAGLSFSHSGQKLQFGIVQTEAGDADYHSRLLNLVQSQPSKALPVDVMVLPEGSNYYSQSSIEDYVGQTNNTVFKNGKGVVISGGEQDLATNYLENIYRTPGGSVITKQQKTFLVPAGELLPTVVKDFLVVAGHKDLAARFEAIRTIKKGVVQEKPVAIENTEIGTLACSGVISPGQYRRLSKEGSQILVNSAELDILSRASSFFPQAKQMLVFQAVANAKPLVQATKGGYSYVISPQGKILFETSNKDLQFNNLPVIASTAKTPYQYTGEFLVSVSFIAIVVLVGLEFRKPGKKSIRF